MRVIFLMSFFVACCSIIPSIKGKEAHEDIKISDSIQKKKRYTCQPSTLRCYSQFYCIREVMGTLLSTLWLLSAAGAMHLDDQPPPSQV